MPNLRGSELTEGMRVTWIGTRNENLEGVVRKGTLAYCSGSESNTHYVYVDGPKGSDKRYYIYVGQIYNVLETPCIKCNCVACLEKTYEGNNSPLQNNARATLVKLQTFYSLKAHRAEDEALELGKGGCSSGAAWYESDARIYRGVANKLEEAIDLEDSGGPTF